MRRITLLLVFTVLLGGCQTIPKHRVHQRALDDLGVLNSSATTIILPLKVEVKEMSVAGVSEVVPAWTEQAKDNIRSYLHEHAGTLITDQRLIEMPQLPVEQEAILEEHTSLARTIWATGHVYPTFGGPAWIERMKEYDYSVGPGLSFITGLTGAGKALLIIGEDMHTTSGRKALSILGAAFGVVIPLGYKVLVAQLIDLQTGDVLWTNLYSDPGKSLLNAEHVAEAFNSIFKDYPDVDGYRRFSTAR